MLSLETLAARENTTTITLRGNEVAVRGLTLAERQLIDDIYLLPRHPGEKADTAEMVEYQRGVNRAVASRLTATAAVAVGWKIEGEKTWDSVKGETGLAKQYLARCEDEFVRSGLSRAELDLVLEAVDRIERNGAGAQETARKN